MAAHLLDRPAWAALNSRHAHLALGDGRARRYDPAFAAFLAVGGDDPQSLADMADLMAPAETAVILQVGSVVLPSTLRIEQASSGLQMVGPAFGDAVTDDEIAPLGPADAPEMLDLALLTRPGPFKAGALALGRFWGVRRGGRLAAMAGERMSLPGYTEVSGVCAHPDFQGQGLARRLSAFVAAQVRARGDTPFLHAYATNAPAIRLYSGLGFEVRAEVQVAVVSRID